MSTAHSHSLTLPPEPTSPRLARDNLRRLCPEHPRLDEAELCLSEIVTNSVVHARTPSVAVITPSSDTLRVEVHDRSSALPRRRPSGLTAQHGRGLLLLDHIADRWGVETESVNGNGKVVWFELDASART